MLKEAFIHSGLSHRESEVALYVAKGLSNKDVAASLFVTEKTIKFHLTNIYKKLGVKSRSQLIVWAMPHMDFAGGSPAPTEKPEPAPAPGEVPDLPSGM